MWVERTFTPNMFRSDIGAAEGPAVRGAISTDSRAAAATRVSHPPFCGTYSAFQSPANSPYMGSHAGGESRTVQEQQGHNQGR